MPTKAEMRRQAKEAYGCAVRAFLILTDLERDNPALITADMRQAIDLLDQTLTGLGDAIGIPRIVKEVESSGITS